MPAYDQKLHKEYFWCTLYEIIAIGLPVLDPYPMEDPALVQCTAIRHWDKE
jgi:hypothetical protein